jgi:hypothetical protein
MYKNLEDLLDESLVKQVKGIAEKRAIGFDVLEKSFDIVKKFIQKKKRIIYGGMSIDMALKAAGEDGIYASDAIPDYDFMSPDAFADSIELADLIYLEFGDVGISSINALHPTTRRVRINFVPVADITYISPELYDRVPTLDYKGFRVIHPTFQRLDMHRAFCNPLEHVPREIVFFRTNKDIKRFGLLDDAYPVAIPKVNISKTTKVEIHKKYFKDALIGGGLAYAIMCKSTGIKSTICPVELEIRDDMFEITCPESLKEMFSIINPISEDPLGLLDTIKQNHPKTEVKYYNKFQDDIKPRSLVVGPVNIHDSKGRLVPYLALDGVKILSPHGVMMTFLERYFNAQSGNNEWLLLYTATLDLFKVAQVTHKLGMSSDTYGYYNWSLPYLVNAQKQYATIEGYEIPITRPPHGYYPADKKDPPSFDPATSWVFAMDGKETKNFNDITLKVQASKAE